MQLWKMSNCRVISAIVEDEQLQSISAIVEDEQLQSN